jgi:sulfoxide reductase catalytic subunit YedY
MPAIRVPPAWAIPESRVTPEPLGRDRREFLRRLGLAGAAAAVGGGLLAACAPPRSEDGAGEASGRALPTAPGGDHLYPAPRNAAYDPGRPLTAERTAARYNNFYEFTEGKSVWRYVERFRTRPWQVEIRGLCERPATFDIDDLARLFPLEERIYRHRCVEAWSMIVPWTGFPLRALLDHVGPLSAARHVRLLTFLKPDEAPGQKRLAWYPWPYYEGLTIEEARHELAFLVTGVYGHALPAQHGAPLRLAVPWKYGFKSIKSIVLIELTGPQPRTFWSDVSSEYDFWANVNPNVPHPRWSQASETLIDTGERVPTLLFNGYAAEVGSLYPWEPLRPRA